MEPALLTSQPEQKFTELLAARGDEFDILAVEPYAGMRKELERKQLNKIIKEGLSTAIPTENATVNAVIAAQAFHWFANLETLN